MSDPHGFQMLLSTGSAGAVRHAPDRGVLQEGRCAVPRSHQRRQRLPRRVIAARLRNRQLLRRCGLLGRGALLGCRQPGLALGQGVPVRVALPLQSIPLLVQSAPPAPRSAFWGSLRGQSNHREPQISRQAARLRSQQAQAACRTHCTAQRSGTPLKCGQQYSTDLRALTGTHAESQIAYWYG